MNQPHRRLPARAGRFAVLESKLPGEDTRHEIFESLPPRLKASDKLGPFRIEREIAAGATGTVYEASQPSESRRIALKVLSPHLALVPRAVARFQAESSLASRVEDPCIVTVYESGKSRGHYFFAMDLHCGETAEDRVMGTPGRTAAASASTCSSWAGLA